MAEEKETKHQVGKYYREELNFLKQIERTGFGV